MTATRAASQGCLLYSGCTARKQTGVPRCEELRICQPTHLVCRIGLGVDRLHDRRRDQISQEVPDPDEMSARLAAAFPEHVWLRVSPASPALSRSRAVQHVILAAVLFERDEQHGVCTGDFRTLFSGTWCISPAVGMPFSFRNLSTTSTGKT